MSAAACVACLDALEEVFDLLVCRSEETQDTMLSNTDLASCQGTGCLLNHYHYRSLELLHSLNVSFRA